MTTAHGVKRNSSRFGRTKSLIKSSANALGDHLAGNTFGRIFRTTTFGESHGPALGVVVDGCPSRLALGEEDINAELRKRRPGGGAVGTTRVEEDRAEILSGLFEGKTTGSPISIVVRTTGANPSAYEPIKNVFRPGHADFTYWAKFGFRDWRGGGRASGRETIGRVAAGAVAKKLLAHFGVIVLARVVEAAGVKAKPLEVTEKDIGKLGKVVYSSPVRCADVIAGKKMADAIEKARATGDSTGGVVEVVAVGVAPGLGEPVFDKLDAELAKAVVSIPAVRGVEIGGGFESTRLKGSENNDAFYYDSKLKKVLTKTNNHGGILGGISTGMPIVARIAVKPTSSISVKQRTLNEALKEVNLVVGGRHDPNICPRIAPVAEAMVALVLADAMLLQGIIPRKL